MVEIALVIGYLVMACGGLIMVALLLIGVSMLANYASHWVLEAYGGWATFREYRLWYAARKSDTKSTQTGGKA